MWLKSHETPSGRLSRWALKLQQYDLDIKYRPKKVHNNVDTLSRLTDRDMGMTVNVIIQEKGDQEKVYDFQRKDKEINKIIEYLEILEEKRDLTDNRRIESLGYEMFDKLLYRTDSTSQMNRRGQTNWRLVIPNGMRQEILTNNHSEPFAAHLGIKRTYSRISEKYFWKGMYTDVKEWISTCADCAMKKGTPSDKMGNIYSLVSNKPFEIVAADIMGLLPITHEGNRHSSIHRPL